MMEFMQKMMESGGGVRQGLVLRAYRGNIGVILLGLYGDNGKENGNYYLGLRV